MRTMRNYNKYLSALLLLSTCLLFQHQNNLLLVTASSSESTDDDNNANDDNTNVCGLYMAESSTSVDADVTVWGIYAGVDMPKGGLVGEPDLAINTHNMMGSCAVVDQATNEESKAIATVHIFEEFIWVPYATGGSRDLEKPGRLVSAISGPGFLGAFNAKLTNSMFSHAGAFFRDAIGEEPNVAHPGRGAFTPFYNVSLLTMETITAGSEIFMDYGANWGEENEDDEEEEELNRKDFERLDAFVVQMINFFEKHKDGLAMDSTGTAKKEIYEFLKKDVINAAAGGKKGRQIQDILPVNPDDLYEMKDVGALKYSEPNSKRKVDWLKENGLCMDNLIVGASTIQHAGRGAFTKRPIPKGQLVAPVPVLQIPDDSIMNMYKVTKSIDEDGEKYWHRVDDDIIGQQLLLNYCYGHPESSMLLFPGGSVTNFINHASSDKEPNAKLIFSPHKENRLDLLEKTPTEMLDISFLGMIMEIVALRDIDAGEEILLDYGTEWEDAWEKHVTAWKTSIANGDIPKSWPTRAIDLNPIYKDKPYPTTEEEESNIPENIRQMCFLHKPSTDIEGEQEEWKPRDDDTFDDEDLVDCVVLQRTELKDAEDVNYLPYNYTIRATLDNTESDIEKEVTNVPHNAILFVDKAETGDQFVTQAFRHYIRIPEDIFPDAWKDKKVTKTPPPPPHDEL